MKYFIALLAFIALQAQAEDANTLAENCTKALKAGDVQSAISFANKAIALDQTQRASLICKGRALASSASYAEAIDVLLLAEKLPAQAFDQMILIANLGDVQKEAGLYNDSIATLNRGIALAKSSKNKRFERIYSNLMGDNLTLTGKLNEALSFYLAGTELAANDNERSDNYSHVASTASALNRPKMAVEYQIKAMLMEERSGDLDGFANAELELGKFYMLDHDLENAEKAINKILKLSKEQGDAYWEAKSYYYLALIKLNDHKENEAKPLMQSAIKIFDDIGETDLRKEISQELSKMM